MSIVHNVWGIYLFILQECRSHAASGKLKFCHHPLSEKFAKFASGEEWITQRFLYLDSQQVPRPMSHHSISQQEQMTMKVVNKQLELRLYIIQDFSTLHFQHTHYFTVQTLLKVEFFQSHVHHSSDVLQQQRLTHSTLVWDLCEWHIQHWYEISVSGVEAIDSRKGQNTAWSRSRVVVTRQVEVEVQRTSLTDIPSHTATTAPECTCEYNRHRHSWLTYSGPLTHINDYQSAAGPVQARESSPVNGSTFYH